MADRIGLLISETQYEAAENRRAALRLAIDAAREEDRLENDIEVVERVVEGLPSGSAFAVSRGYRELVEEEGVLAIIGPSHADNGRALIPAIDESRCATLLLGGSPLLVSDWTFNVQCGDMVNDAYLMIAWCFRRGLRRIGILRSAVWHSAQWLEHCQRAAARLGLEIAAVENVPWTLRDARQPTDQQYEAATQSLSRLREARVDVVIAIASLGAPAIAYTLGQMDWDVERVTTLSFGHARHPDTASWWEGWVGVAMWDDDNPQFAALMAAWEAEVGPRGGLYFEDLTIGVYDSMRVLIEAIALAPLRDRAGIREGLERVKNLPATSGRDTTVMGFGPHMHRAYNGRDSQLLRRQAGPTINDCVFEGYLSEMWPRDERAARIARSGRLASL
jgi:branched-chain amino acid transport system substrate-binding protein